VGFNLFPFEMAVVLDNGGFSVKIGYSTDEEPRYTPWFKTKNRNVYTLLLTFKIYVFVLISSVI